MVFNLFLMKIAYFYTVIDNFLKKKRDFKAFSTKKRDFGG
jgi:hypothetical protein